MADPERLELPTPAFEAQCSIQLSYGSAREYKRNRLGDGVKKSLSLPAKQAVLAHRLR